MRYRKKPVVVEAMQWDGSIESATRIVQWAPRGCVIYLPSENTMAIVTPRGTVGAEPTDWIICASRAPDPLDLYPCPAATFAAIYEAVP